LASGTDDGLPPFRIRTILPRAGVRETRLHVIMAGILGNVMEWYDFAVYGYFVTTIGRLFFPATNRTASLMAAYGAKALRTELLAIK